MKERNKSKITVIILFILMLISLALLIVFIIMASNNIEENINLYYNNIELILFWKGWLILFQLDFMH